jgi:hypothetical protein
MLAVASGILAIIVSVFMQREGVVAIQVIAYGIWFFLSKYVNHYSPGEMLLFDSLYFFSFKFRYSCN